MLRAPPPTAGAGILAERSRGNCRVCAAVPRTLASVIRARIEEPQFAGTLLNEVERRVDIGEYQGFQALEQQLEALLALEKAAEDASAAAREAHRTAQAARMDYLLEEALMLATARHLDAADGADWLVHTENVRWLNAFQLD
jgi:hypothetical protein